MLGVWVLTKSFTAPHDGNAYPVAWSYGYNHSAMGYESNGWGLAWISMDVHQFTFLKAGIDPNVQVLDKLGDTEPRFWLERDPRKP